MPHGRHRKRELPLAILVMEAGVIVQDELRATLAKTGLRPRHCQLLMHLSKSDSTTQQALIEALDVDASVLVGLLNDLEGDGFVQRLRDPADRRRHIVQLSGRGGKQAAKIAEKIAAVENVVFAGVSAGDRTLLRRALQSAMGDAGGTCSA